MFEQENSKLASMPTELHASIASHLDIAHMLSLSQTCLFFHNHDHLKREIEKSSIPKSIYCSSDEGTLFIIDKNNHVFGYGDNHYGQLGTNNSIDQDMPSPISILNESKIIQVASGSGHTLFLSHAGKVYSCGENRFGQLGQEIALRTTDVNNIPTIHLPTLVTTLDTLKIIKIACGHFFSIFLTLEGDVFVCGSVGRDNISTPIRVNLNSKVVDIACGSHHAILLTDKGYVFSSGSNYCGQSGQGHDESTDINLFRQIRCLALTHVKIIQIVCGGDFTMFLSNQNEIYACGRNYFGVLGIGNNIDQNVPIRIDALSGNNVTQIVCGHGKAFFLTRDGMVYVTGWNKAGQLGVGDGVNRNIPTPIDSLMRERVIGIACGPNYTLYWSNKSFYMSGKNQFSAFKLINAYEKNFLTPHLMQSPLLHEPPLVSSECRTPRPWDID